MINWLTILINSFWIFGLAVLLAAFSYHYWEASQENRRLKVQFSQSSFRRAFWIGLGFIGVGLAGTSRYLWEAILWIIFILASLVKAIRIRK